VLRNERKVLQNQSQDSSSTRGVAGAAGNIPPQQAAQPTSGSRGNSSLEDETRNYEIGKTVTKTTSRSPRLKRLSVAILLDGVDAKPRSTEEVTRLGELAKKAVGFDETRGDQFEISSVAFSRSTDKAAAEAAAAFAFQPWHYAAAAGAALLLLGIPTFLVLRRRKKGKEPEVQLAEILRPGAKVGDLLAGNVPELKQSPAQPQLPLPPPDPALSLQERARQLAQKDPVRAAHLLRAWMAADIEAQQGEIKA
jgi:flagellar M-ring protein FliF